MKVYCYGIILRINVNNIYMKKMLKLVNNNIKYIDSVYTILNEFAKLGIKIDGAGEWLLDNVYIIRNEANNILHALRDNKDSMPYAEVYNLAYEYVRFVNGKIGIDSIRNYLTEYTKMQYLSIQQLWIFPLFIKISLIQCIKEICEKIEYNEKQKYKVESILEKYVLNNDESNERKFLKNISYTKRFNINLSFIEYMAYRLRKLENIDVEYIDILDKEIIKLGTTVDEVVEKHHHNVVIDKIEMGNCIISLKNIDSINFSKEFECISDIDQILSQEKANMYSKMDYATLKMYREKICDIAKRINVSEKYLCSEIIKLCAINEGVKSHSGYYIFSDGIYDLYNVLGYTKYSKSKSENQKLGIYLAIITGFSVFLTLLTGLYLLYLEVTTFWAWFIAIFVFFIPYTQVITTTVDKSVLNFKHPKPLPSLDLERNIPNSSKTMVVIPTLISSIERLKELMYSLEEIYLTNRQDNIYFCILGDCKESDKKEMDMDKEIIKVGNDEIQKLNQKYNFEIPKFYFLYRKRKYNGSQQKYLGWERKRGMLTQFNRLLLYNEQSDFYFSNIFIKNIKYVLTIDADTKIGINNVSKLIGIMEHPLNIPTLNKEETKVINGYALLQPRIALDITVADKNVFSLLWGRIWWNRYIYKCNI